MALRAVDNGGGWDFNVFYDTLLDEITQVEMRGLEPGYLMVNPRVAWMLTAEHNRVDSAGRPVDCEVLAGLYVVPDGTIPSGAFEVLPRATRQNLVRLKGLLDREEEAR